MEMKVDVGVAHKMYRANNIFKDARASLPKSNWLHDLDKVPMEKNVYIVSKSTENNNDVYNVR